MDIGTENFKTDTLPEKPENFEKMIEQIILFCPKNKGENYSHPYELL